jgi:hypothetical protein
LPYLKEDNHGLLKSSKDYPTWIRFLDLFTEEKMQKTIDTRQEGKFVAEGDVWFHSEN